MIKWITPSLGTAAYNQVETDPDLTIIDVRDMVDKSGNLDTLVRQKIDQALTSVNAGRKTVICCDYGMSRSNAIAAGVLAELEQIPFNQAVTKVINATNERAIKIEVLSVVRSVIKTTLETSKEFDLKATQKSNLLITGASGFVGKALIQKISSDYNITCLDSTKIDLTKGSIELDCLVKDFAIDCIVHLANPRIYTTNESMGKSLSMLKNVLDACHANQVRLFFLSSLEVYSGYKTSDLLVTESTAPIPKSTFGKTKHLCEILTEQYYHNHNVDYALLRAGIVYGSSTVKPKFISNFLHRALSDKPVTTHQYLNGFPSVNLLHIQDLISAICRVLESKLSGAINLGSRHVYKTVDIAKMIIEMTDSKSEINHHLIQDYTANILVDSSKANRLLGWEPKIELSDGIREFLSMARGTE